MRLRLPWPSHVRRSKTGKKSSAWILKLARLATPHINTPLIQCYSVSPTAERNSFTPSILNNSIAPVNVLTKTLSLAEERAHEDILKRWHGQIRRCH
mmetsp:Transcript_28805/g.41270  ORF Transcript_28805/g.41270 Transcript_28805/m.41270 type:complete len:97 (+) Transcript_28805:824-1114(+)